MPTNLQLALTNIGDLLLNNKITQDKAGKSISDINLVIPNYQRPYKWIAKNAIQLLDDILDAMNANREKYRVGTLILHKEDQSIYNIVDGQQRTITFSLLLKALDDSLNISFLAQPLSVNSYNKRNVPHNFRALARRVNNMTDDSEKTTLLDYIKNNCELIVVITDDVSQAFQFFDSQNARGKKLYPHDLLKAYHLREMNDLDSAEIEKTVKEWEDLDQSALSSLFNEYLNRVKEWAKGNRSQELTEHNIQKFKGITRRENYPYAQFYKGAYSYSDMVNHSAMPFVAGVRRLNAFQLDTPIIAGKPFFDYAKHYFDILDDIKNNDKYAGHYIRDNDIVKTLNLRPYNNGVGNRITRLLFNTAILLYVDRFCPERLTKLDSAMLDQFVVFAFIWAYSLRAQYYNVGWLTAQNYILRKGDVRNSFNIYSVITEADTPATLLGVLSGEVNPLPENDIVAKMDGLEEQDDDGVYQNYLYYFKKHKFMVNNNEN